MKKSKVIKILEGYQEKYREQKKMCVDNLCTLQFNAAIGALKEVIADLKKMKDK